MERDKGAGGRKINNTILPEFGWRGAIPWEVGTSVPTNGMVG
jgi:hypothetical protein